MKYLKRVLSFALALCTAASLVVGVHAADETETQDDARFKDKTWEEVMDEFMTQYGLSENNIAVGYMNLVTGEELPPEARQTTFTNMMKIGLEIAVKMANK